MSRAVDPADVARLAGGLAALGCATRLEIFARIAAEKNGQTVSGLAAVMPVCQPTISHHVKKLLAAGLLDKTVEFPFHRYTADRRVLADLADSLRRLR